MMRIIILAVVINQLLAAPWTDLEQAKPASADGIYLFESSVPFEQTWQDYKQQHGKSYEAEEEEFRKEVFRENMKSVQMHNYLYTKGKKSFSMEINQYSDMETHEFARVMNGVRINVNRTRTGSTYLSPLAPVALPKDVDWRTKGYVTPVKNQGQCGSCWAFSTTGSLEGQHFHKSGKLVSLSEQQLVDCSEKFGNHGCMGGLMDNAFKYIKQNNGLDTEDAYPYVGDDDKCTFDPSAVGATDTGFTDIDQGDEKQLMEAVATVGPVSVAIDAGHKSFQMYKEGVYDEPECSSTQLDHGVLVVGYGTSDDGLDYWLVKNSWSSSWGMDGYIKMSRNKDNQCGIASSASYPLV